MFNIRSETPREVSHKDNSMIRAGVGNIVVESLSKKEKKLVPLENDELENNVLDRLLVNKNEELGDEIGRKSPKRVRTSFKVVKRLSVVSPGLRKKRS